MKPSRIIRNTTLALGLTAALAGSTFAADKKDKDDHDTVVPWSQVPPAVQATITAEAKGGKVETVEMEKEGQGMTYEAKVKLPNGDQLEIKTDAAGKVLKVERDDADDKDASHEEKGKGHQ